MNSAKAIVQEKSVDQVITDRSEVSSKKVYINKLMTRHNQERAKEKIETLVFVGLACALVIVSGIVVSF